MLPLVHLHDTMIGDSALSHIMLYNLRYVYCNTIALPTVKITYVGNPVQGGLRHQFQFTKYNGSIFCITRPFCLSWKFKQSFHFPAVYGFNEQLQIVWDNIFRNPYFMDCTKTVKNKTWMWGTAFMLCCKLVTCMRLIKRSQYCWQTAPL